MKKILTIILLLLIMLLTVSCDMQEAPNPEVVKELKNSRFVMINWSTIGNKPDVYVYVDTETGVAYSTTTQGSLLPLYNADGSLLVYEEYIK